MRLRPPSCSPLPGSSRAHADSAASDYKDDGTNVLLDANENAYGPGLDFDGANGTLSNATADGAVTASVLRGLHRYPDPHLEGLKQQLCDLRNDPPGPNGTSYTPPRLTPVHLFCGVGSDEVIDALLRCFCTPGYDRILTCPPTYGMYDVSATVNDVAVTKVSLRLPAFDLDVPAMLAALEADPRIKLVYLCSPGNPTGALLPSNQVLALLASPRWQGLVVLDEAYVDFAAGPGASLAPWVPRHPRLVVMQTLSKGFGLAGARLGAAFADPSVARLLNSLKAPYNVSALAAHVAGEALGEKNVALTRARIAQILEQRGRMLEALRRIPGVGRLRGGLDANFVLLELLDGPAGEGGMPCNEVALQVYERMAGKRGVVVRFRGKEYGCEGCLRITVGTPEEVDRLVHETRKVLEEVLVERGPRGLKRKALAAEVVREEEANGIVS